MAWYRNTDAYAQDVMPTLALTRNEPPERWASGRERLRIEDIADLTDKDELNTTCAHESAHAVLYMAAGHRIESMTIHGVGRSHDDNKATVVRYGGPGPWQDFAVAFAAGERAADRWLRQSGLWTPARAWAIERLAGDDRALTAETVRQGLGCEMSYGVHSGDSDYFGLCSRAEAALDRFWPQICALARQLADRRFVNGTDAARIAGF